MKHGCCTKSMLKFFFRKRIVNGPVQVFTLYIQLITKNILKVWKNVERTNPKAQKLTWHDGGPQK